MYDLGTMVRQLIDFSHHLYFIIIGILGLGFLIGFHELGHFLFCKLFSIRTPSFSIGFGPKLISKKIGETEFSISAIPFGGYVEIAGSAEVGQGDQQYAHSRDKYSFAIKPYYQKLLVMSGGIIFNLLFAYVALTFLFMTGLPKTLFLYPKNATPIIRTVESNSAAQRYGLMQGDYIIAFNDTTQPTVEHIINTIKKMPSQSLSLTIERNEQQLPIEVTLDKRDTPTEGVIGTLGVTFEMKDMPGLPFIDAVKHGIALTHEYMYKITQGLLSIFQKKDVSQLAGPLMITSMTIKGASEGLSIFLIFLAIISINLAILNLLPLPILDGGQILFYTIEAIVRRPLPEKVKEYIHITSWIGILILTLYLTAQDIIRIAHPHIEKIGKMIGWNK